MQYSVWIGNQLLINFFCVCISFRLIPTTHVDCLRSAFIWNSFVIPTCSSCYAEKIISQTCCIFDQSGSIERKTGCIFHLMRFQIHRAMRMHSHRPAFEWKIPVQCLLPLFWKLKIEFAWWASRAKSHHTRSLSFFSITWNLQTQWALEFRSLKLHKLLKMQFSPSRRDFSAFFQHESSRWR